MMVEYTTLLFFREGNDMASLRRLGDEIDLDSGFHEGDRRIMHQLDNLAISILFPKEGDDILRYYIFSTQEKTIPIKNMPPAVRRLGDYERMLLDKILRPQFPVICIRGRMGSGKTTTMQLMNRIVRDFPCDGCPNYAEAVGGGAQGGGAQSGGAQSGGVGGCKKLIATLDFKNTDPDLGTPSITTNQLISDLCDRLWNKCSIYFSDPRKEFVTFWKYIMELNDHDNDHYVESVFDKIIGHLPYLREEGEVSAEALQKRQQMKDQLMRTDKDWYLKYLILLWRYLLHTQYLDRHECAMVVLDNLDSLPTRIQRELVSYIQHSAHSDGPTFMMMVRDETFHRVGLNDNLLDVVAQQGPDAVQVIFSRIDTFLRKPDDYFNKSTPSLPPEDREIVIDFLTRMTSRLRGDKTFYDFVKAVAGKSIRNALLLAQGLFELPVGEMRRGDLTSHYVIRAMLREKGSQFRATPKAHVINPFDVEGEDDGRFLIKIRILKYIEKCGGSAPLQNIISTFNYFDYASSDITRNAIRDLVRNECQLLTSDGFDTTYQSWGDVQDNLTLTEIGQGYINQLICDVDFVGEVMLDAKVDHKAFPFPSVYNDKLCTKLSLLYNFLRELHKNDVQEVKRYMTKAPGRYPRTFGQMLISLEIIQGMYPSVGKLMQSQKTRSPENVEEYEEVVSQFTSLLRVAEDHNNDLFGVVDRTLQEFVIT
jgi:hypothetical protein